MVAYCLFVTKSPSCLWALLFPVAVCNNAPIIKIGNREYKKGDV